jgi:AcrR family transcriptional regulator
MTNDRAKKKAKPPEDIEGGGTSFAGRATRVNETTQILLKAALQLAYDGGIENATVERIAQQTGIAKTTIYRRWANAAAIVMDAFFADIGPLITYVEKKSVTETFTHAVRQFERALGDRRSELLRRLLAAAQQDEDLQRAFWSKWIEPRRVQAKAVIEKARLRGEIRRDVDADILDDMIFGPVYYRLMIPYAPLNDLYAKNLIAQVFSGVSA